MITLTGNSTQHFGQNGGELEALASAAADLVQHVSKSGFDLTVALASCNVGATIEKFLYRNFGGGGDIVGANLRFGIEHWRNGELIYDNNSDRLT